MTQILRNRALFLITSVLLVTLGCNQAYAKEDTSKIVIQGSGLTTPIKIKDPKILLKFRVWSGPGTSSNEKESFIINWSQGVTTRPPTQLLRYEVRFYVKRQREQLIYVVSYAYDPVNDQGYVYLPGSGDEWYSLNVGTIYHSVEGQWFHASRTWQDIARSHLTRPK